MLTQKSRRILKFLTFGTIAIVLLFLIWSVSLYHAVTKRIEAGWFLPPVELYSAGDRLRVGDLTSTKELVTLLQQTGFRERAEEQSLHPGDFAVLDLRQCEEIADTPFLADASLCVFFRTRESAFGPQRQSELILVILGESEQDAARSEVKEMRVFKAAKNSSNIVTYQFPPRLFAQYYNGEPIQRRFVTLGDVPLQCLQAVTSIEDRDFLEHRGVSVSGLSRALLRNLSEGRYAQGGSTITQQLVKNYFLSPEKTLKRKVTELLMAVMLEATTDKDTILQNYLNVIYMGQDGPFQVLGFGAASEFYLGKPIGDLELAECSLLAAVINNPGRYNLFKNPENARARRSLVLDRMVESGAISPVEANAAKLEGLPSRRPRTLSEPAPYFTAAVLRETARLGISIEHGARIFTSLDESAQELAQTQTAKHVDDLENGFASLKKIKDSGKDLQALLLSIDVETGDVLALVGGRKFVKTQYNRAIDAHRQAGSLMKPFVYLTALTSDARDKNGEKYGPLSILEDRKFRIDYEGQSWSPRNYTKEFYGEVPMFAALKDSLNAATAALGLSVGLKNIVETARAAGITSRLEAFPSLTLGAFEVNPIEIAEAYLTLARFGSHVRPRIVLSVEDMAGNLLYLDPRTSNRGEQTLPAKETAILVNMLKQTLDHGTGKSARARGFLPPAAGKTGTTSDTKDAWFAGFTPATLTVTWVGYDDNTPSGLTGATGALPLWADFMKAVTARSAAHDFKWPEDADIIDLSEPRYQSLIPYEH